MQLYACALEGRHEVSGIVLFLINRNNVSFILHLGVICNRLIDELHLCSVKIGVAFRLQCVCGRG